MRALEERKILLDLAHASPAAIDDALQLARRPVVVSHTGVRGTCDNARNLSDAQLRAIAGTGGVGGIGSGARPSAAATPPPWPAPRSTPCAWRGWITWAWGADFDGAVTTAFDASGYAQVTSALLAAGLPEADVAKVMGGNVARVLKQSLP